MGRPRNEKCSLIDKQLFEEYALAHNTEAQIAGFFRISINTLSKWCRKTYKMSFKEITTMLGNSGVASIKKMLFKKASKGNITCMLFYLKNFAGMSSEPKREDPSVDIAKETFGALKEAAQKRYATKNEGKSKNAK